MERGSLIRTTIVLGVFAVVFITLTVGSYTRESATVDEPQLLTGGYAALRLHDYRIDVEHPPFLRLWQALPLLAMPGVRIDTNSVWWTTANEWQFSHHFLYELNDADYLLYRARFMTVLLGIVLGILLFGWARELFGFWPAATILALYCVEPNILAHARLVTTDFGLTCFFFGAAYFLWRTTRKLTAGNVAGVAVFFALAQVSKFSALLLGPIVLVLLGVPIMRVKPWPCVFAAGGEFCSRRSKIVVALAVAAILGLASYAAVWAVYGFHYGPITHSNDLVLMRKDPQELQPVHRIAVVADWLDQHHLVPDAYAQSFLLSLVKAQHRTAYLSGKTNETGWWYYFPVAFLVKTPLTILVLFFGGLALLLRETVRRNPPPSAEDSRRYTSRQETDAVFLVIPPVIFLGVAMTAHINIGLRHVLPIYPFVLLITGVTLQQLREKWRPGLRLACVGLAAVELATVYPHCLAFFNQSIGGPRNGHLVLLDSNLDWGQDLKPLKCWMDANHVETINLSYFGTADPEYYGIIWAALPGTLINGMTPTRHRLRLPGYVAVSAHNLYRMPDYSPLLKRQPAAIIGESIYIYWVEIPWWETPHP